MTKQEKINNTTVYHAHDDDNKALDYYISGFVDGEGCFSVSFRKIKRFKLGIEVRPSFSVSQKQTKTNLELLEKIKSRFKGGAIRIDSKGKGLYKYETRALSHIRQHVITFFDLYPLHTEKRYDFINFCKICSLVAAKQHLNESGLLTIISLAEKMNPSGQRRIALSSLRALLLKKTKRSSDLHK